MSAMGAERVAYWMARYARAWKESEYPHGPRMTVTKAEWEELQRDAEPHAPDPLMIGALVDWSGVRILVEEDA